MRIGTYLDGAKVRLPHGQFTDWLNAEFDMSERTAENYMSVARKFASKSELISDLPPSLLYKLAAPSTPETIVTKVIEDIKAGHPIDARGVMKEINAYRRSLSHSEGKPQHTSKAADLADDSDDQQEQQVESADRTQEQADAREVTTILSSLADTDLRRLNELLKKPSVWRSFRDLVSAARAGANALDIPPQLDRRVGPLLEEAMER
jgi:hypothetical protein